MADKELYKKYLAAKTPEGASSIELPDSDGTQTLTPLDVQIWKAQQEQKAREAKREPIPMGGVSVPPKMDYPTPAAREIEADEAESNQRYVDAYRTDAKNIISTLPQKNPTNVAFQQGVDAYQKKDFIAAARAFNQAHQQNPTPLSAYAMGQALEHGGDRESAENAYEAALVSHYSPSGAQLLTDAQRQNAENFILNGKGARAQNLIMINQAIQDLAAKYVGKVADPVAVARNAVWKALGPSAGMSDAKVSAENQRASDNAFKQGVEDFNNEGENPTKRASAAAERFSRSYQLKPNQAAWDNIEKANDRNPALVWEQAAQAFNSGDFAKAARLFEYADAIQPNEQTKKHAMMAYQKALESAQEKPNGR